MSMVRVRVQEMLGTSSVAGMLTAGSRTIAKTEIMLSVSTITRETMTSMALTTTSPPDGILQWEAETKEESKLSATI
jgi:hypothetical protein